MAHITDKISSRISNTDCNVNVTPNVINDCIAKLKRGKSDGDIGLNSNHYDMVGVVYGCYYHCCLML